MTTLSLHSFPLLLDTITHLSAITRNPHHTPAWNTAYIGGEDNHCHHFSTVLNLLRAWWQRWRPYDPREHPIDQERRSAGNSKHTYIQARLRQPILVDDDFGTRHYQLHKISPQRPNATTDKVNYITMRSKYSTQELLEMRTTALSGEMLKRISIEPGVRGKHLDLCSCS